MRTKTHTESDGSKTVYTYDEKDQHVSTTDYDAQERITCDIRYDFDDAGRVSGWQVYQPDGLLFKKYEMLYSESGLEEVRQYDAQGCLELRVVETYDEDGKLIRLQLDREGRQIDEFSCHPEQGEE